MAIPKLFVRHLTVLRDGKPVYDQKFRMGVNILRGDNGTGKSTVIDLLSYALGAEVVDWTKEQGLCDEVIVEVLINSKTFCLKRQIVDSGKSPMAFYEGSIDQALNDSTGWLIYPSRRSESKHSYSQQMFEMLGLPQHETDDAKNLTIHQIMRLMYVDQVTQTTKLLKEEPLYDNATIRKAIGEYLLGIDDLEAHNLRQALNEATRTYEAAAGELKAIFRILGSVDATALRRSALEKELISAETLIISLEGRLKTVRSEKIDVLKEAVQQRIAAISATLETKSEQRIALENEKALINTELIDTRLFLESLDFRLKSIEQSKLTHAELGEVSFKYCPSCLSLLGELDTPELCNLCKAERTAEARHYSYIRMINELNFQIRESIGLIKRFQDRGDSINFELPVLNREIDLLKNDYEGLITNADASDATLTEISEKIGYYRSAIVSTRDKIKLCDRVEDLIKEKSAEYEKVENIKTELRILEEATKNRRQMVYDDIESIALGVLRDDEGYEPAFEKAEEVSFDFGRDKMFVDGRSKFSASSMVIMKNAIRYAIFLHAIEDDQSRFPRLLLIDNIEDKGMMPARSQNFQRKLIARCDSLEKDFQLIFTTSMIDPALNESDFVIGPFYFKGTHTLRIG